MFGVFMLSEKTIKQMRDEHDFFLKTASLSYDAYSFYKTRRDLLDTIINSDERREPPTNNATLGGWVNV